MALLIKRYGLRSQFVSLLLLIFIILCPSGGLSAGDENLSYINSLIKTSSQMELYKKKYWHTLIHYRKNIFGTKSLIDDPKFFLAEDGKHNPQSELEATIKAFFSSCREGVIHPRCRFMARYTWLNEKLNFDESKLPVQECEQFNRIVQTIQPETISLVFPASYMNSPASMFGHTLLIIESKNKGRLLSYAVNYSALTNESFGIFFAVRGIFGLYKGYFSVLPYYLKVQEYSNVNQRDIWEYKLNFTREEIMRIIMHLYELDKVYSDYFFFDENCSYNLLYLIDIARPSLNSTDSLPLWVIPIDTIREITLNNKLLQGILYRPSKATKIKYIASLLDNDNQNIALDIINKKIYPDIILEKKIDTEKKINICDLSREYVQYQYLKKQISKKEYTGLFVKISTTRSKLGNPDKDRYTIPEPGEPTQGHESNRVSLGGGIKGKDFFQEIRWRAAYHEIIDSDYGYLSGSQIQFCSVTGRYYYDKKKFELNRLIFVDILSISPVDKFFMPVSWKVSAGLITKEMRDEEDHIVYYLNTGAGFALKNRYTGTIYAMIEPDFNFGKEYPKKCDIGLGGALGIIKKISDSWKIYLKIRDIYYIQGDRHNAIQLAIQQNFSISTNNSIGLDISGSRLFNSFQKEGKLYWNFYF